MTIPDPIGKTYYSQPRAVMVRQPGNLTETHSAVSGTLNFFTDSYTETETILGAWPDIVAAANAKAMEILNGNG